MPDSHKNNRVEGKIVEIGGAIKKGVGQLIGNEQMELEGGAKELKGQAEQKAAMARQRTKGAVEELKGGMKKHVGRVIDNEQMEIEGKLEELQGQIRQKSNK